MINQNPQFPICIYNKECETKIATNCYRYETCLAYAFYEEQRIRESINKSSLEDITDAIERGELHG